MEIREEDRGRHWRRADKTCIWISREGHLFLTTDTRFFEIQNCSVKYFLSPGNDGISREEDNWSLWPFAWFLNKNDRKTFLISFFLRFCISFRRKSEREWKHLPLMVVCLSFSRVALTQEMQQNKKKHFIFLPFRCPLFVCRLWSSSWWWWSLETWKSRRWSCITSPVVT
jgi:hypothetical protein